MLFLLCCQYSAGKVYPIISPKPHERGNLAHVTFIALFRKNNCCKSTDPLFLDRNNEL